jgi:hypothetical protein
MLHDMVDRDRLASGPTVEYRCSGCSSYDRKSIARDKPGWFDNKDYNQFIREEKNDDRTEEVLMDADGPGALVRFWNAVEIAPESEQVIFSKS